MNHLLKKIHPSLKGEYILAVGIQLISILLLLLTGPLVAGSIFLIFVQAVGIFMIVWGYAEMRKSKFTIFPHIRHGSKILTSGPFEIVRHPMYSGILLTTLVLVIEYFTFLRALIFFVIAADLLFKVHVEEILLQKHFGEAYETYKKKTHKLIPYIY